MNWSEFDEIYNAPQREAEAKLEREKQFEELDNRERMAE